MIAPRKRRRSGPSGPSIPDAQRHRPPVRLTLAPEEIAAVDAMALADGLPRSRVVGACIRAEVERRKKAAPRN